MSYKLKSLFYLICFLTAIITYYGHAQLDKAALEVTPELAKAEMQTVTLDEQETPKASE